MKLTKRLLVLASSLGLAAFMSSCQSTGAALGTDAVTCDKCKTVWIKAPTQTGSSGKGGFVTYRDVKTMECPDCQSAVVTFFKTGVFKHTCSHCGGAMTHCTKH